MSIKRTTISVEEDQYWKVRAVMTERKIGAYEQAVSEAFKCWIGSCHEPVADSEA